MSLSKALLPEFDHEMANARRTLERIPDDKFAWKPHERSFAMGELATHIANMLTWVVHTIERDSLDIAPPDAPKLRAPLATSQKELLDTFDQNLTAARAAIEGASDEHLFQPWTLLSGGEKVFTIPRIAVLRSAVMNHIIHHRGQMSVYLRLNDIPVPSLYGPSADEGSM